MMQLVRLLAALFIVQIPALTNGDDANACDQDCTLVEPNQVCGSDFQLYNSTCDFQLAKCTNATLYSVSLTYCGITAEEIAACQNDCPRETAPVCGTDGVTYINECLLGNGKCEFGDLEVANPGACSVPIHPPYCSVECTKEQMRPMNLCGSDGFTYPSACQYLLAYCERPTLRIVATRACTELYGTDRIGN